MVWSAKDDHRADKTVDDPRLHCFVAKRESSGIPIDRKLLENLETYPHLESATIKSNTKRVVGHIRLRNMRKHEILIGCRLSY